MSSSMSNPMSNIVKQFTPLNLNLLGVLILVRLIPVIYQTVRVHFLGDLPSDWGFNIASQIAWLHIFYEVINEGFLLPLYYILAQAFLDREEFAKRLSFAFKIFMGVYAGASITIWLSAEFLVVFLSQEPHLIPLTIDYIRLETIAIMVSSAYMFMLVVFTLKDQRRIILWLCTLQALSTIILDMFLVSSLPFSWQFGVMGVAYTNIIVNGLMLGFSAYCLSRLGISLFQPAPKNLAWLKRWGIISARSGLESFVRNAAFLFMILRMMNIVQEQGTFWVTNQFIWGWLLLPILALGELIKSEAALGRGLSKPFIRSFFGITALVIMLWVVTIPLWPYFLSTIMGIDDYQKIFELAVLLLIFYIIFALNNVIDSLFYGLGRTDLMLVQSLAVSILFYGTAFVLFWHGIFQPDLMQIALMFGLGISFDAVITGLLFWYLYTPLDKNYK